MSMPEEKDKYQLKTKAGFTLVELIISVGTLAIVGIIVIQFFMSTKDMAKRAEDLDQSVYLSNYIIESAKSELWDLEPLNTLYTQYAIMYTNDIMKKGYYNEDWESVKEDSNDIAFELTLNMDSEDAVEADKSLYSLELEVKRLQPYFRGKETEPVLHTIKTSIYIDTPLEVREP